MKRDDNMPNVNENTKNLNTKITEFLKNKDNMIKEKGLMSTLEELKKISDQYQGVEFKYEDEISNFLIESVDFSNKNQIELIRVITIQMVLFKVANYLRDNRKKTDKQTRRNIELMIYKLWDIKNNPDLHQEALELLEKMKKEKLKGRYGLHYATGIEWHIQEDITIYIDLCASGAGSEDLFKIMYKVPNKKEPSSIWDASPHACIMEVLKEYNDSEFIIKKVGKIFERYKLIIKKKR